eukprot:9912748-Alexandrium_andersonii.AAC.1
MEFVPSQRPQLPAWGNPVGARGRVFWQRAACECALGCRTVSPQEPVLLLRRLARESVGRLVD